MLVEEQIKQLKKARRKASSSRYEMTMLLEGQSKKSKSNLQSANWRNAMVHLVIYMLWL